MAQQSIGVARLNEWLVAKGVSLARLCADLNIHPLTPYQWRRGQKPSLVLAVRIEQYTDGAVPCSTWLDVVQS